MTTTEETMLMTVLFWLMVAVGVGSVGSLLFLWFIDWQCNRRLDRMLRTYAAEIAPQGGARISPVGAPKKWTWFDTLLLALVHWAMGLAAIGSVARMTKGDLKRDQRS